MFQMMMICPMLVVKEPDLFVNIYLWFAIWFIIQDWLFAPFYQKRRLPRRPESVFEVSKASKLRHADDEDAD